MYIKSIAISIHSDDRVEFARGMFKDIRSDFNMTGSESRMSCLQVKALMTMLGKLRKVKKMVLQLS
jgi:hypothetical protein